MAREPRSFLHQPFGLGAAVSSGSRAGEQSRRRGRKTADGEDLHEWALRKVMAKAAETPARAVRQQRELLADLCRILGARLTGDRSRLTLASLAAGADPDQPGANDGNRPEIAAIGESFAADVPLSPRVRQTLERLLQGDSEKQVARRLRLSTHTVHVYVKTLYRKMNVNSRSELLAKFIRVPA
jgi:DNA-binding CsgD family transcriptional regulator